MPVNLIANLCLLACFVATPLLAQRIPVPESQSTARGTIITMHDLPTTGTYLSALSSFDETILAYMEAKRIPGAAFAIVRNGQLIYARGYGYADREAKTPVQPTSLFRLASVSKPITAVAVMTLVQSGKLKLDDHAFARLGWEPFLKPGGHVDPRLADITVRHLLEHSAGWDRSKSGDIMFKHFEVANDMNIPSPPDHKSLIQWAMGQPLDFTPGTQYAYSNFGFCVLGRIIEKVSGMTYEKYVQKSVLAKMGIRGMRIGNGRRSERTPDEVCYYDPESRTAPSVFSGDGPDPVALPYAFASPQTMDAHGGWIASAVDMARFAAALDAPGDSPILTVASTELMLARPASPLGLEADGSPSPAYYALGWQVRPLGNAGRANVWHNGGMPGTSTLLVRLGNGISWVILFNAESDGSIDGLLHKAAAKVLAWPDQNLFPSYSTALAKP